MYDFSKIECKTPDKCRFTVSPMSSTCMYYPPSYDRSGKNQNPDGNVTSGSGVCVECGKRFAISVQYGKTEITVLENTNELDDALK